MKKWESVFEDDYFLEGVKDAFLIVFLPGPKNEFIAWGETSQGSVDIPGAPPQEVLDKIIQSLDKIWKKYTRFERSGCEVFLRKPYNTIQVEVKGE